MTIDVVTASLLVGAAMNGMSNDAVADLYKMFKNPSRGEPSHEKCLAYYEQIAKDWPVGARVNQRNSTRIGVVHSHNTSASGFYPGWRYPIYVQWDAVCFIRTPAFTYSPVFEYGPDDLERFVGNEAETLYINFLDHTPSGLSAAELDELLRKATSSYSQELQATIHRIHKDLQ